MSVFSGSSDSTESAGSQRQRRERRRNRPERGGLAHLRLHGCESVKAKAEGLETLFESGDSVLAVWNTLCGFLEAHEGEAAAGDGGGWAVLLQQVRIFVTRLSEEIDQKIQLLAEAENRGSGHAALLCADLLMNNPDLSIDWVEDEDEEEEEDGEIAKEYVNDDEGGAEERGAEKRALENEGEGQITARGKDQRDIKKIQWNNTGPSPFPPPRLHRSLSICGTLRRLCALPASATKDAATDISNMIYAALDVVEGWEELEATGLMNGCQQRGDDGEREDSVSIMRIAEFRALDEAMGSLSETMDR